MPTIINMNLHLVACGHTENTEQQTIIQQYGDWYTGSWWVDWLPV